jgi:LPS export ABC transporter protein LptC
MNTGRTILMVGVAVAMILAVIIGLRLTTPHSTATAPPPRSQPAPAPDPVAGPGAPDQPFLNIEGTQLSGSDPRGRRLWDLKATTLQVDRTKNIVTMIDVSGQLFEDEKPALAFKAPRATFFAATKDVELTGGVIGRTPDGRTLRAPRVRWDARKGVVVASGGVTVTQPGMIIRADSLTSDAAMRRPTFRGNISVQVTQ